MKESQGNACYDGFLRYAECSWLVKNELNGAISGQFCKIVHFTLLSMTNVPVAKLAKRHNEIYDVIIEPMIQEAGEMILLMKETKQRFQWRDLMINLIILNCVKFILFH